MTPRRDDFMVFMVPNQSIFPLFYTSSHSNLNPLTNTSIPGKSYNLSKNFLSSIMTASPFSY